jgi:hypothetical protein
MFIHFVVKELGVKEIVQVAQALIGYSIPEVSWVNYISLSSL